MNDAKDRCPECGGEFDRPLSDGGFYWCTECDYAVHFTVVLPGPGMPAEALEEIGVVAAPSPGVRAAQFIASLRSAIPETLRALLPTCSANCTITVASTSTMHDEAPHTRTLAGRDLSLWPIDAERDAPALHSIFGDGAQLEFMVRPPCATVADTATLLRDWNRDPSSPQWSVVHDEVIVGRITLVKHRPGIFEVGVQVVPGARGRGIATRAIIVVTIHGLEHLEACRIYADIDPNNIPCVRAFRRAGFRFEGTLLANWKTARGIFDSDIYAATAGWSPPE